MYIQTAISARLQPTKGVFAVDMQRVFLIPIMKAKSCYFTSRLQVYNETFASLSGTADVCVVWHEATTGRGAADVASAYVLFMEEYRYRFSEFLFWADNCSSQNKNRTLFSALLILVNSPQGPYKVTIQYLERGHTFMRADAIHGLISSAVHRKSQIESFAELVETISTSKTNIDCQILTESKTRPFSSVKLRNAATTPLRQMKCVEFVKGQHQIFYKTRLGATNHPLTLLPPAQQLPSMPDAVLIPRGIKATKKAGILSNLVPLMAAESASFWNSLPILTSAHDSVASTFEYSSVSLTEFSISVLFLFPLSLFLKQLFGPICDIIGIDASSFDSFSLLNSSESWLAQPQTERLAQI